MTAEQRRLFCFGLGYSAQALAGRLAGAEWAIAGTSRHTEQAVALTARGWTCALFDRDRRLSPSALAGASHILVSAPPDAVGDPVLDTSAEAIAALCGLRWLGYLSTTGVYGDHGGRWVDEASELRPAGERGRRRVAAEAGWLMLWRERGVPVHIFRLAGIYGPGRSPFDALRAGAARRIDKPGQVFSRIHAEDLAGVLAASIERPRPGAIYNVCDDEAAPSEAVVGHAAALLGMAAPPLVRFEDADLSPMARSFYDESKRVSNALIKRELGVVLRYPTYREGLAAIRAAESGDGFDVG